jgi:hypothetical protein
MAEDSLRHFSSAWSVDSGNPCFRVIARTSTRFAHPVVERAVRSVANNARADGREFLAEAARLLKHDAIRGAGVLVVD